MEWKDALPEIQKLAPEFGALFGAPGIAAGTILSGAISLITGTNDPAKALQILQADPNKVLELQSHLQDLRAQHSQAVLADIQDARKTMAALAASHSAIAWGPVIISGVVLVGFFVVIDFLFFVKTAFNEQQAALLNQLFGALVVMAQSVVQFWIGSSRGSQNKDFYIANLPTQYVRGNDGNILPWKKAA